MDRQLDQKKIVDALLKPQTYVEKPGHIELIQTHISFVFLTDKYVYKVKKPVNFGFLDFSTLEKRRFYCQKELDLNRRLCKDMYLEVVPITKLGETVKIGGDGEPVEYTLKMKRLPQDKIMTRLLKEGKVDKKLMDQIAEIIVDFHAKAETNNHISEVGSFATVKTNWDENLEQTRNLIGKTISTDDFYLVSEKVHGFMAKNEALFEKRLADGRVKDCHGDMHSGNIFITDHVYIFDAIEFNERFRFCDVASDMAFLAMDLDFRRRADLSEFFVEKYTEYSKDVELLQLLSFYKCYRAYVRGKVIGFKLADANICDKEKMEALQEAKEYMKLAVSYAKNL